MGTPDGSGFSNALLQILSGNAQHAVEISSQTLSRPLPSWMSETTLLMETGAPFVRSSWNANSNYAKSAPLLPNSLISLDQASMRQVEFQIGKGKGEYPASKGKATRRMDAQKEAHLQGVVVLPPDRRSHGASNESAPRPRLVQPIEHTVIRPRSNNNLDLSDDAATTEALSIGGVAPSDWLHSNDCASKALTSLEGTLAHQQGPMPSQELDAANTIAAMTQAYADAAAQYAMMDTPEAQMMVATLAAHQTQFMQQFQFYQQLQLQDMQEGREPSIKLPSRFKDDYRPMKLCRHTQKLGFCRQGAECKFAHDITELHPASPDLPEEITILMSDTTALADQVGDASGNDVPDMRMKKKKELCERFSRDECFLGKICPFAHSEEELGTVGLAVCGRVKMKLCTFWDPKSHTSKGCLYGKNCKNAHGEWEIGTKAPPIELCPPGKRKRTDAASAGSSIGKAVRNEEPLEP